MKLAVFTSKYPARVSTFFERDMAALQAAGVEIDVFCLYPLDEALWKYSLQLNGEPAVKRERVHHLGVKDALAGAIPVIAKQPWRVFKDTIRILISAARFGPVAFAKTAYSLPKAWTWAGRHLDQYDHVLGYWGNYTATAAYAFHRLQSKTVPFSMWLHAGTDLYRQPVFMKQKMLYSDNIVTCCEFNFEYIRQHFPSVAERITPRVHVCHHGLDLKEFPFTTDGRPSNKVIAVGRLAAHKGFDYLVRAAHALSQRGVDMVLEFVGDGEEQPALEALARELGIIDRVVFKGWLPFPEVRKAMSQATVLAMPSDGLGDGLPNVIREAMALGTPVVATRVAGIPDALEKGCGVLVPPKDADALADGIETLLRSPDARRRIAERARARVEERYDLWKNGSWLAGLFKASRRRADVAVTAQHVLAESRS
jgi:glycosyltransferase involved in cell wall biosynthesis